MPSIVFPAPGCETGQQFVTPFVGFDLTSTGGGLFVNLLKNSYDLSKSDWIRGGDNTITGSNYKIVDWYVNEGDYLSFSDAYVLADGFGGNIFVSSTSTAFIGQIITVTTNTTYTASFYAKRGTASDLTYAIYDQTNAQFLNAGTSYFELTTSTGYTRITTTFLTSSTTTDIIFYPIYNTGTNSTGSVFLSSPQVQIGFTATTYDATKDTSFAALGVSSVVKTSYKSPLLSTFVDPAKDFEAIGTIGQNKVKWNVVNDYIFDNPTLTYTSENGNTEIYYIPTSLNNRPYNIGDTVTISSINYRQNFTVTSFTTSSITISTSTGVPRNGVQILNPNPSVYPSAYELLNLVTYVDRVTAITKPRENYALSQRAPNVRGVSNFINELNQSVYFKTDGKIRNIANRAIVFGNKPVVSKLKSRDRLFAPIQFVSNTLTNVAKVQSLTTTTGWLSAREAVAVSWPLGLYRLSPQYQSGIVTGVPSWIEAFNASFADNPITINTFRLESFDNQGVYVGRQVGVVGTDIVQEYDFVNEYLYDYNFTSSVLINDVFHPISGNPQEFPGSVWLNYNPSVSGSIEKNYFPINSYVRIVNTATGFDQVTLVSDVTPNSIYVELNPTFPIFASGTTIQDASPFYYPKEQIASTLSNVVLPIENVATPRENLFYSEYRPRIPGRYILLNPQSVGENQAVNLADYANKLELYYDTNLPGDFRTNVVGQNNDFLYGTAVWYANENDLITGTSITNVVKLIFFQTQDAVAFRSGSQIRVRNTNINYDRVFTVLTGTNYSITILNPGDFPIGSITTVEQTSTSVYPRTFVKPITRPTNPRENLYYFELAPGYRRNTGYAFEPVSDLRSVNKVFAVNKMKLPVSLARAGKVNAINKLKSLSTLLTVNKVTQAAKVKQPTTIRLGILEPVKWKSNRVAVFFTPQLGVTRNISVLKFKDLNLTNGNLANKSFVALKGVTAFPASSFAARVNSYLSQNDVRTILKPLTPAERFYYFNLAPGLRNNSTISYGRTFAFPRYEDLLSGKVRSVAVLRPDRTRFTVEKLKVISPVKGDRTQIISGNIQPVKFRAGLNQLFFAPTSDNLVKQLFKLKDLTNELSKLSSGKLRDVSKLRSAGTLPITEKLQVISPVKGDGIRLIPLGQLQPMRFRASTAQIFYTPLSADLTKKLFVIRSPEQSNFISTTLTKRIFKLVDLKTSISRLDSGKLRDVSKLKGDAVVLRVDKLSAASNLKADNINIRLGILQPVKFRSNTNQIFFTPTSSVLTKQLFKLTEFNSNITSFKIGKLKDISSLRSITAPLITESLTKKLFKLSGDVQLGKTGLVKIIIKAADVIDKVIEFGDIEEKYKILTGLNNLIFVGNARPIFKANTNQVFERPNLFEFIDKQKTPASLTQVISLQENIGKLRAAQVLRTAIDKKDRGLLKAVNKVISVPRYTEIGKVKLRIGMRELGNVIRLPGNLSKQILKIKSVGIETDVPVLTKKLFNIVGLNNNSQPLRGVIQPIKFRSDTTEVFFAPYFGKTKLSIKLFDQSDRLKNVTTLTKKLFRLTSLDYYKVGKVKSINKLQSIINLRQQGLLRKQLFDLKSANDISTTGKDKVGNVFKFKYSSIYSHVFWIDNDYGQLGRQLLQLRSDGQRSIVGKVRSVTKVIFDKNVFVTGKATQKYGKNQVQLFFTPREGKTTSISKLIGYKPSFTTGLSKLKIKGFEQTNTLKNVFLINRPTFAVKSFNLKSLPLQGNIDQYRQNKEDAKNPIITLLPNVGFVRSISKLKTIDKRSVAKVSAVNRLKDPQKIRAVAVLKTINKLKQATSNQVVINDINSYFDQLNYTALIPNTPAEWFFYFNMAPGFRYNKTIQQGIIPTPITYQAKVEKLSTFDNQGLVSDPTKVVVSSTDPIVNIIGRTQQFTNDVILQYIFDRDVLTILPVNSPTITLYFIPMENISTPFVAGQTINIFNSNNLYNLDTSVLSATADSVTISDPGNLPSISGMTVKRPGINYSVRLYYNTEFAGKPLYPVGSWVKITDVFGKSNKTVQVTDAGSNYLEFYKDDSTIQLTAFKIATLESATVSVYPRSAVKTTIAPQNARENLYYAEVAKGLRGIFVGNSRFAAALPTDTEVYSLRKPVSSLKTVRVESIGNMIKLISGDYKKGSTGITDVAAPKKEPIQFWN